MKKIFYFLFFVAVGAGIYLYTHKPENFKVKDQVVVSQASGMDISGPITAPPKYAVITGTISNISENDFSDVELVYQSGLDTVRAAIGFLPKSGSSEFQTNSMRVRSGHPDYELIEIRCTEAKLNE